MTGPILREDDTCWRIEKADRVAMIVDAADYFATIKGAIRQARYNVLLIGWDFDTRIKLDPRNPSPGVPDKLGRFLEWAVEQNPGLHVYLLKWDLGIVQTFGRGSTPMFIVNWMTSKRIRIKLDHAHPSAAAHHQKIVVIDDALAFCGGIDMTADRWDTREHADDDPRRRRPTSGRRYGPWHDVTMAVDGAAARALGELARDRWKAATGEDIPPAGATPPTLWPEGLTPSLQDVRVGISRTMPEYGDRRQIAEIEKLALAVIGSVRRSLYIESQYFASRRIAEAIIARLGESDGPEIVIVNPESADGWLEEEVMGSSRARLLQRVRKADLHGRFRLYTPVTTGGAPIYVHAKVLVADDMLLRIGSSNLNNRSLGYDTECDLSIEVDPDAPGATGQRRRIVGLRDDLLSEHLGVDNHVFAAALERAAGSLIGAIEALRGPGRSLVPFETPELNVIEEEVLAENALLDPERPTSRLHLPPVWSRLVRWARTGRKGHAA